MRHFRALRAAAQAKGWPTHFKRDLLVHDRRHLRKRDPEKPFLWVLRDSGTHIVDPEWTEREHGCMSWEHPAHIEQSSGSDCCLWYWWDGYSLTQLSDASDAKEHLSDAARLSALLQSVHSLFRGRTFQIDGEPLDLVDFVRANAHDLELEEWLLSLMTLDVAQDVHLGGGAFATTTIRRVA